MIVGAAGVRAPNLWRPRRAATPKEDMRLTVDQIIGVTGGKTLTSHTMEFDTFGIDSRKMKKGSLFFALKGENTDGHLYVGDAAHNGATGAVVDHPVDVDPPCTLIQVQDSLRALHSLGAWVRNTSNSLFIGITGSAGKTSTKEFTAALVSQKHSVFKSEGNLNSITGMPLSLLAFNQQQCGIFEVGMNQPGEISALSMILQPQIAVLLNVSAVHLGQFSSIEAIADEKVSLIRGLSLGGTVVYNADDPLIFERIRIASPRRVSYGTSLDADLQMHSIRLHGVRGSTGVFRWKGRDFPFETKLCGEGKPAEYRRSDLHIPAHGFELGTDLEGNPAIGAVSTKRGLDGSEGNPYLR